MAARTYNDDTDTNERINKKLLDQSVFFLANDIGTDNILEAIRWITYENSLNTALPLHLYINSSGGDLYEAMALIDIMNLSKRPIYTYGIGSVMSAAFLIFISGSNGNRYIGPNCGIMCHQYSGSSEGKHHDLKAEQKENDLCHSRMLSIVDANTSKMNKAQIKRRLLRATDTYMTPDELIECGLADHLFV